MILSSRTRARKVATCATALGLALIAGTAGAQTADDRAAAEALFDAARKLMDEKKYDEACPKFRDSNDLDPGVGTLLNLALCYKEAGKTASAWFAYREAASAARSGGQEDRETLARDEAAALEAHLVKLLIQVEPEAEVPGLQIERGDQLLKESLWGVGLPVDPGDVTITASAPGYVPRSATVKVEGEGKTITFRLTALQKEGALTPPPPDEQPTEESSPEDAQPEAKDKGPSPWPWVLGGVGVAAAGTGTVFAFLAQSDYKKSTDICSDASLPCTADDVETHNQLKQSTKSKATVAYIGWGVGGAALIGAGVWLLVGGGSGSDSGSASRFEVAPLFDGDSFGLGAHGTF